MLLGVYVPEIVGEYAGLDDADTFYDKPLYPDYHKLRDELLTRIWSHLAIPQHLLMGDPNYGTIAQSRLIQSMSLRQHAIQ